MNEEQIASELKQNVQSSEYKHTPAPEVKSDPNLTPVPYELDEITQYKLHQHFGEDYREGDQVAKQQLAYIYENIASKLGTNDYPVVVAKINELKRMLGFAHASNARYKLYEWIKLDQKRSRIEQEMNNIQGSV